MPNENILVTDNILSPENEHELRKEGFEVYRLAKHSATEDELIEALKGKSGYILGGIETVTERVIKSVDKLRAIVYNNKDYRVYIPAHEMATRRGIAIANCPGADSAATAEFALTLMLSMERNVFDVGRTGPLMQFTGRSIGELRVGIIGLGDVGYNFARLLRGLEVPAVFYFSRTRHEAAEKALGITYLSKKELLSTCNVISVHTPRSAGVVLNAEDLALIPQGGLVINVSYPQAIDSFALLKEIRNDRLRAAFDFPPEGILDHARSISPGRFFWSNEYAGYNTSLALRIIGNMATASIINLLKKGTDKHLVNPEYHNFRNAQDTEDSI